MNIKKTKVLLVEDHKTSQKIALLTLNELNCDVDAADTGGQALELFKTNEYDIIFMDLGLPDIDGLTVTETIRRMETSSNHIPIVALTAHSDDTYKVRSLEIGMNDFLMKPLTAQNSQTILDKYVNNKG